MTCRDRFLCTLRDGAVGCAPRFEREIRDEVVEVWEDQGYPRGVAPEVCFGFDRWQNGGLYGSPRINLFAEPPLDFTPTSPDDVQRWRGHFRPDNRFPADWAAQVAAVDAAAPLGLGVFRGLFLTFGVSDGDSLQRHALFLADCPDAVDRMMGHLTDWTVGLISRALADLRVDYLMFHEPIAGHNGPVIGPRMFRRYLGPLYSALVELGRAAGIGLFIFETYGQVEVILDEVLATGCNTVWISHAAAAGTDYRVLRRRYPDMGLVGGVDDRALMHGDEAVRRELAERTTPLLAGGRYIPMLDDRVRPTVPFACFRAYHEGLVETMRQVSG